MGITASTVLVVLAAAFFALFIISPFEYAWSSMSGHIGAIYGWSPEQVALMFTTFIIFQSVGMLPGGMLRDTTRDLIDFAQQENISHVVFGQSARSRFDILLRGSIINRFLAEMRETTVQVVPMNRSKK